MNKTIVITLCAFFLLSATVVEVNTIIFQPKVPKSVIVIKGYLYDKSTADLQGALNTYASVGFVVSKAEYNSNSSYLIILEKY